MTGKHASDEEFDFSMIPWKKIGIVLAIIALIVLIVLAVSWGVSAYKKNKEKEQGKMNISKVDDKAMPEEIEGYSVLGKLVIENLEIEEYILDSTEEKALENGVGKLHGNDLNSIGNFVIVGHNYDEIFKRLEELEVGNEFYVEDFDEEKTNYKITEITTVEPTDLSVMLSKENKTEITLITCQEGATARLIVKAEKVENAENVEDENTTNEVTENENSGDTDAEEN